MANSQQFLSSKYDDLPVECDRLKVVNKKQEEEIKQLKFQSVKQEDRGAKEDKIDAIEQYGHRQNLERCSEQNVCLYQWFLTWVLPPPSGRC